MMIRLSLYKFLLCLILTSCQESKNIPDQLKMDMTVETNYQYTFSKPDTIIYLNSELKEISGLSYDQHADQLIGICDEKGIYYRLNTGTAVIESKTTFYKDGDYEAIEMVEETLYASKSNGDVFEISSDTVIRHKTALKSKNDLEGLCLSPDRKSLLMACKAYPLDSSDKKLKTVYEFDLDTQELRPEAYLKIHIDSLIEFYSESNLEVLSKYQKKELLNRIGDFSPSAIACHPVDQSLFILSARGSSLLILDNEKNLKNLVLLNENQNPQPEGICFDEAGTLFIATEGKGLQAKLFIFKNKI